MSKIGWLKRLGNNIDENGKYLQLVSDRSSIPLSTNILCKSGYLFIILSNFCGVGGHNTGKPLIVHSCTRTSTGCEWRCAELRSGIAKISPAITHSLLSGFSGVVEKSNFLLFFLVFTLVEARTNERKVKNVGGHVTWRETGKSGIVPLGENLFYQWLIWNYWHRSLFGNENISFSTWYVLYRSVRGRNRSKTDLVR